MDKQLKRIIERCSNALNYGSLGLSDMLDILGRAGVESCHVDYRIPALICYAGDGEAYSLPLPVPPLPQAAFDRCAIRAMLAAAQGVGMRFAELKRQLALAGCVAFFVWIDGQHITCLGRHGEIHDSRLAADDPARGDASEHLLAARLGSPNSGRAVLH